MAHEQAPEQTEDRHKTPAADQSTEPDAGIAQEDRIAALQARTTALTDGANGTMSDDSSRSPSAADYDDLAGDLATELTALEAGLDRLT